MSFIAVDGVDVDPKRMDSSACQLRNCCIAVSKSRDIWGYVLRMDFTSFQSVLQLLSNLSSHSSGRMFLLSLLLLYSWKGATRRTERQGFDEVIGTNLTNRTRVARA